MLMLMLMLMLLLVRVPGQVKAWGNPTRQALGQ